MKRSILLTTVVIVASVFIQGCECPERRAEAPPRDICAPPPVARTGQYLPVTGAIMLEKMSPTKRMQRLKPNYPVGIEPWDDGSMKLMLKSSDDMG